MNFNKQTLPDISTLNKYDSQGMYKIYDNWPMLAKESYASDIEPIEIVDIDSIVFAGMGGSGSLGDIFQSILSKTKINSYVIKGYHLPNSINSDTLIVTTSVSGNTTETLTLLESAKKMGSKIVAFSSGGKMKNYCIKNNIEYREILATHSPRASFPIFLYSMLKVLNSIISVKKDDIYDSLNKLKNLSKEINSSNLTETNPSINLANWITGIPLIYYPFGLQSAAIRFKNSLQENAKSHALVEDVIEACHNGIVSWERTSNIQPILVEGHDDHVKTKERWGIIKEYFNTKNIDFMEIHSAKGSILSKIVHLIYLLDYSTIYLAVKSGIDPTPIQSIDFIKKSCNT